MKTVVMVLSFILFSFSISLGFGKDMQGCGSDCAGCHKITKNEVSNILKTIDPEVNVDEVKFSKLKGLYEVVVKKNDKPAILYLDFGKNHIVLGRIIDIKEKKDITRESIEEQSYVNVSKISTKNAIVMGNKNGKTKLYVFTDPDCPFCAKLHKEIEQLVKEEPDLKVYLILIALPMHKDAKWKAQSIICTSKKDMSLAIKMLEDNFQQKMINKINCGKVQYVDKNKKMADSLGIGATPTIVFPNGKMVMGAIGKEEIKKHLKKK